MRCTSAGGGWGNGEGKVTYTVYFHMEFSKPLDRFGVWKIDVPDDAFPVQQGLATSYFHTDQYQDLVRARRGAGRVQRVGRKSYWLLRGVLFARRAARK